MEYAVKPFPAVTECVAKTKKHKPLSVQTNAPKYRGEESLPFVPDEKELDQLIAACKSRRMAAYLQTLKETFADPGEILRLEWKEIDFKNNIISVNHPVKGHDPRQLQVSTKLLAMLSALPKKDKRVFPTIYQNIVTCFRILRARTATVLQNTRLNEIQLRTFRHWGGTMIAHYTHGNVLAVKRALGHKNIQNTMKYIHLVHFKDDEFEVATATSVDEAKQLASSGYEKFDEFQGIHIFRKPKRLLCYS